MAANKIIYGNDTLIDLTGDTATEADVVSGKSFHLKSGVQAVGTAVIPEPATATPLMDGTGAVGTATKYAREDHKHPSDTTKLNKTAELQTTNPFAPESLRGIYISKIDNAFYAADKRWTIASTNTSGSLANLFDGDYESQVTISNGNTAVITIDFSNEPSGYFPSYPYGYILVSFYYNAKPTSVSGRVYCNYAAHGIGWKDISFSPISDNTTNANVYRSSHQSYYNISQLEITVVGDTTNSAGNTKVTQIEMHLDRPYSGRNPFLSKYSSETLYYNLTAPKFIGALQGNADTATTATTTTNVSASAATSNADRHVWFSDSAAETKRAYDNDFKYNPSTNTLTVSNVTGNAATATTATKATQDESGNNIKASYGASLDISGTTLSLKNKNGTALNSVTIPSELPAVTSTDNGKVLRVVSGSWETDTLTASDVSAVPTTRTVNSKALSSNITLTASDVSAVPTTRTVNSKALSADITLTASDVGALADTFTESDPTVPSWAKASSKPSYTASEVGAVPTTRKVNNKALSADITLTASDVGALADTYTAPVTSVNSQTGDVVLTIPSSATGSPLMDGTAAVGTSDKYAKEDHVHPSDTAKANLASPALTGTPTAPTATAGTNTTQIATTAFVATAVSGKQDTISDLSTIRSNASDGETAYTRSTNKVLYYTSVAVSATTGDIATVSNAAITADHVVVNASFADPSKITTQVTWTTAAGSLTLNGTCTAATTVNVVLIKKDN